MTKILAVVDALGNLGRFILLPGQRHDCVGVTPVLKGIEFSALLADKAFDNNAIRTLIAGNCSRGWRHLGSGDGELAMDQSADGRPGVLTLQSCGSGYGAIADMDSRPQVERRPQGNRFRLTLRIV